MEAAWAPEFLRQVAHFRAAQQHVERPVQRSAGSGEDTVHQRLLLGRHFVVTQRLEAAAPQMQVASGGGLGVHNAQDSEKARRRKCAWVFLS